MMDEASQQLQEIYISTDLLLYMQIYTYFYAHMYVYVQLKKVNNFLMVMDLSYWECLNDCKTVD